ncbi:arf-GAP with Rho-GAP domain, ANK repeat and PH domain-containing protein 2 [Engraulis encrasicolus]|uniref:arf-GAP with Rho-GAP domain, ANK repeat and PH domain-containing protein 2 n=1 Tax=Engraulis encrasicolus TaxID=184585 RepID=UPI002FD2F6DE
MDPDKMASTGGCSSPSPPPASTQGPAATAARMTSTGGRRSSPAPPAAEEDVLDWLSSLHLPQYAPLFTQAGLLRLGDLRGLTAEKLQEVADFPTGHRRRMLRSLEALGLDRDLEEEEERGGRKNRGREMETDMAMAASVMMGLREGAEETASASASASLSSSSCPPVKKKPLPRPRHVFLKDRKRGTSCLHPQTSTMAGGARASGAAALAPGSTMTLPARRSPAAAAHVDDACYSASGSAAAAAYSMSLPRVPRRPRKRRDSPSISGSASGSGSANSSSCDSLSVSSHSLPSDVENVSDKPVVAPRPTSRSPTLEAPHSLVDCPSSHNPTPLSDPETEYDDVGQLSLSPTHMPDSCPSLGDGAGGEDMLMVDNDIYEMGSDHPEPPLAKKTPLGPRNTRSYRLKHRPVPELPAQAFAPPQHNWNESGKTTEASAEPIAASENTSQKKGPLERTVSVITPYGEVFLYNNSRNTPDGGDKGQVVAEMKEKLKQKKIRKKQAKQKERERQDPKSPPKVSPHPVLAASTSTHDDQHHDNRNHGNESEYGDYSLVQHHLEPPQQPGADRSGQRSPRAPSPCPPSSPPAEVISSVAVGVGATAPGTVPVTETVTGTVTVPVTTATTTIVDDDGNEVYEVYTEPSDVLCGPPPRTKAAAVEDDPDISPYACFYGAPRAALKSGWLDKLSPQGNRVFQKRWVKFDGDSLTYYNNDKEMYSKGLIPLSAVKHVRALGDNRLEVVTCLRTFVFRAEREAERQEWLSVLQEALSSQPSSAAPPQRPPLCSTGRCGPLELRGHKGRVYVCLLGTCVRLCKTEQDFNAGLAIAVVELTSASVKHVEKRAFEINTPFKTFCFTADSEQERDEWVEGVQECIVETLSDYEVAEKIWYNEANRNCADCRAPNPEWASINLVVVICKKCAAQHRFLGPGISQVRSMKLDSSIWSNELVELFLEVGNRNANSFWACSLPPEEELHMGASAEQRATFHRRKYRERKYRRPLDTALNTQDDLNKALCVAVVLPDVLRSMALLFSGADPMCATGDPSPSHSTPYQLAQRAGQRLQMEFLYHNKHSDFPKLEQVSEGRCPGDIPLFMDGFLYCSSTTASKAMQDRRARDDMVRRWCTLEGGFLSYYDNEKIATATGRVEISEVMSLTLNHQETMTGAGAVFTFEMFLPSEKVLVFGAETAETHRDWTRAVSKCFLPAEADSILRHDCELIGRLFYKEGHDLYHWRVGWFGLEGSDLYFCCPEGTAGAGAEEGTLQLRRLQEITVSTHVEGEERIQVLLMVEGGRTVYIHGHSRVDFSLWHSAIQQAAGTDGRALGNQQLSKNDVPIAVDSCIAFVTQYGLCYEGIYQKSGDAARVAQLLEDFRRDARNVKLRAQEHLLEDVTDTLKAFLAQCEDALLAKELYPYWVSALDEEDEETRVQKYSTFIRSLPPINRATLQALLEHLYRIQRCSPMNHMSVERLACVLSPCLFQTEGQKEQEAHVVQDLISNYVQLFAVNEEQVKQMERENSFITRWKDTTQFSPAGDLIFEVYLEKKDSETCCIVKVSPTMQSAELASCTLGMKGLKGTDEELWTTYEVLDNGELERPLHYREKVLEQVLEWSSLEDPGSAFLLLKKFPGTKMSPANAERLKDCMKGEQVKFKDGSSKLLSANKFQERYLMLRDKKLVIFKDMKSTKAEREVPLKSVKCYLGVKKKVKPPNSWGFTVFTEKQQWYFCCDTKESPLDWVTCIIRSKFGSDLWPKEGMEWGSAFPSVVRQRTVSAVCRGATPTLPRRVPEAKRKSSLNIYGDDVNPSGAIGTLHQRNAALIAKTLKKKELPSVPDARAQTTTTTTQRTNQPHQRHNMAAQGTTNLKPKSPSTASHQPGITQRTTKERVAAINKDRPLEAKQNVAPVGAHRISPGGLVTSPGAMAPGLAQQKRPMLGGGGGQLPPNLLSELSTVLSKTGRSAKSDS